MRRLLVVVLLLSGAWMIWWVVGSVALERGLEAWIEERRAEGWAADVAEVEVAGFPNRFDTTLTDVRLADPDTGVAWTAPFVQFLALAYRPTEVIAVLPETHRLSTPLQTLDIASDRTRGSIRLDADTDLALRRSTFIAEDLRITSSAGWRLSLDEGRFSTARAPARVDTHRVGAELLTLTLPEAVNRALDPVGILPDAVERLHLDMTVVFDAPWDRRAIEVSRPQITALELDDLSAEWGEVTFRATGEVTVDASGRPDGEVAVRAVEWRRLLDMLLGSGLVDTAFGPPLESALELLAGLSGSPETLDVTLSFRRGSVFLGPVALGPAPNLTIR